MFEDRSPCHQVRVRVFGNVTSADRMRLLPTHPLCVMNPPMRATAESGSIARFVAGELRVDGVVAHLSERPLSIAVITRDCYTVALFHRYAGVLIVVHVGRDQIMLNGGRGIIGAAQATLAELRVDYLGVEGWMLCGIAPEHFPNDRHPELVRQLSRRFGPAVIPDPHRSTIDLPAIIRRQCGRMPIRHDGLDTYSDPRLGSRRAEHDGVPHKNNPNYIVIELAK